jgi:dTDP-glucose 4,6-dehydratase
MNSSKIRAELGWRPRVDFETGLERTVKWYLDNREWWQRIKTGEYMRYYEKWYGNR